MLTQIFGFLTKEFLAYQSFSSPDSDRSPDFLSDGSSFTVNAKQRAKVSKCSAILSLFWASLRLILGVFWGIENGEGIRFLLAVGNLRVKILVSKSRINQLLTDFLGYAEVSAFSDPISLFPKSFLTGFQNIEEYFFPLKIIDPRPKIASLSPLHFQTCLILKITFFPIIFVTENRLPLRRLCF